MYNLYMFHASWSGVSSLGSSRFAAFREIRINRSPNDGSDVYTSVLTIEKATLLDAGQYTCQVVDWGVQQCKGIYIEVRDEPDVKVVPMSASIEKVSRN